MNQSSISAEFVQDRPVPTRYGNARVGVIWFGAAAVLALSSLPNFSTMRGVISLFMAAFCLQAALLAAVGVSLRNGKIRFPRPVIRQIPPLTFGQKAVDLADVKDLTYLGDFVGSHLVTVSTSDEQYPILLQSRAKRLAFFESIAAHKPGIRIYRAY